MDSYYSDDARKLHYWALEENNRVKSSKIYEVAQRLEKRWRDNHKGEVNNPYRKPIPILPTDKNGKILIPPMKSNVKK